ncbi:uncharacterized protein LOC144661745 isoform X2 [Oculina patagonica]
MKPPWLCLFFILTSLGINSAAGNTNKEGVHVEEDAQGSYSIKIKISRDVNHREVVVNINLNAIELENLSVNLKFDDTLNSKSSENTKPPHEGDRNEPKDNDRSKPDGDSSIVGLKKDETNDNQTVTEDIALKENKTMHHGDEQNKDNNGSKPDEDPSIVGVKKDQGETANDNQIASKEDIALTNNKTLEYKDEQNKNYMSNWFWKIWNTTYKGLINMFACNELTTNITQNCLPWRTVTAMRTMGHSSPGYDCEDPANYITNVNKSSVSVWSSQPVIQGDVITVKTEEDKEMYHVPFILRMPRDYRLPGHNSSQNMNEVIHQSLANKQNRNKSVESQRYPNKDNVSLEREATLLNKTMQHGDKQNKTYMSNWFSDVWNITYEGLINVFGWNELPKNINQHWFHWRSVTMSTTSHLFPGYDGDDPTKYITNGNKSSASAWSSQPVIRGDITQVKKDEDKEMHDVPFILRMPKDYRQYRLQGHNFTVNMDEVIDRSLTKKQNGNIFVESQRYQTKDNVSMEREATLFNKTMQHGDKQNKTKNRNKRKPDGDPSIVGLKEDETNDNQTVTEDIALSPGHNFTVDMNEIIPRNLTDKQNRNGGISVESHRYQTTDNVSIKREAILTDKNSTMATIKNASWLAKKSPNFTRMEPDDGRILVEKVSGVNYLARFYGNTTRIAPTNSFGQEIFEIIVMYWMFDIGVMNLNCTACFIKGIIWLLRMLLERKLKKEQERLRKLEQKGTNHERRKFM